MPSGNDKPEPDNGGLEPPRPPRMPRGAFSWVLMLMLGLMLLFVVTRSMNAEEPISLSAFRTHLENGQVSRIDVRENDFVVHFVKGQKPIQINGDKAVVKRWGVAKDIGSFQKDLRDLSPRPVEIWDKTSNNLFLQLMVQFIPWLLLLALLWFLVIRQFRQAGAGPGGMLGNFGRSRHRITTKEHTHITFADVAGIEEAKEEVFEIVEFLKNAKRFQRLGGRIPRGVLLVGEPGCGKTLLAKAIAGEADVPFFSISGSDFVEMFVGVGASRVRDLFRQAKENAPCIIFLDEIDAVGRRRGVGYTGGGHDEREQTLNAILVEMDGFESNDQVIVIAATNRADVLDPALVRPGRFDRQVFVPMPDVKGRFEILRVHARKIKLQPPIDTKLQKLARATPMFSGADLAAIMNEAALLATLAGKDAVDLDDLEEARDKIRWGRAKRSRVVEERDRELTAYHEAGHAVVQTLLEDADPVHKVSIIPRGPFGGATFSLPEKDRMTYSRSYVQATLRVLCAGRIAETRHSNDASSGAAMDIEQVTKLARAIILEWGMSERLGFVKYSPDGPRDAIITEKPYSDETAHEIDNEVRQIIDEAYRDAERVLNQNWTKVEAVALALLKHETLEADEVRRLCQGETIDRPSLSGILANEAAPPKPQARPIVSPSPEPGIPPGGYPDGTLPQPG